MKTILITATLLLVSCDHLCPDNDKPSPTPPPFKVMDSNGNIIDPPVYGPPNPRETPRK